MVVSNDGISTCESESTWLKLVKSVKPQEILARLWFQVSNVRGEDSHFGVETRNHQLVLRGFALRWPLVVMIDS